MMKYDRKVVIFIDILGSREMRDFSKKYEIHSLFHSSIRESQERQNSDALSHVVYDRKLFSFSDCAYIVYSFKEGLEKDRQDERKLIQVALYNTSILLTKIMSKGYLVRGGATFGDAFVDDDGCFGPAVDRAYEIESKKAIYPRVMLDNELGQIQYQFETEIQADPNLMFRNKMTRNRVARIANKLSDEYFLNTFYHLEMERTLSYDGEEISIDTIKEVLLNKIETDLATCQDERVIQKLDWFKEYVTNLSCCLKDEQVTFSFTTINA
ncbi:hypothetical protein [Vibrio parahaemolyticus]|uniref:hypothetical protein n=3 Tax=Vibrio parahaemolyticus TaxID=670 RepID=UPI0011226CBD|nr:hypothetical protein [Vibrio parahaemolyticus]TOL08523.1 hypothetical protein CGI05_23475 [Vibrio parahaemolyticus]HCG6947033.1 hypothetical protein [Vibrio parahaemolyticus]